MRNTRVALCVNRYVRQEMVSVLTRTSFGRMLVSETEGRCRPSDCPGRERLDEVCHVHADDHEYGFFRHCDTDGNLIHLDVSMYCFVVDDDC